MLNPVWAQEGARVHSMADEVLASPDWKEYTQLLAENYLGPIDVPRLEQHCRRSVAADAPKVDAGVIEDCLRGAAEGLEFFTSYVSIADTAQLDTQDRRGFVGIGIEFTQRDGLVLIVSPIHGSPAERAGLKPGDFILSLNGKPLRGLPLAESARLMRGEPGTDLTLVVARLDPATPLTFVVRREAIRTVTVRSKWVSPEVAYVRISQFREETRNEVIAELQKLQSAGKQSPKGLVFDLRSCPGGLLDATADISSLFVLPGVNVLGTTGRRINVTRVYKASVTSDSKKVPSVAEPPDWPLRAIRVVVLVDRRTGGGAEALAALLKEARGATIVGETSSGFGIVQQLFRLKSGASIRIATALMSAPSGGVWNGKGIEPDVVTPVAETGKWEFGDLELDAQLTAAINEFQK